MERHRSGDGARGAQGRGQVGQGPWPVLTLALVLGATMLPGPAARAQVRAMTRPRIKPPTCAPDEERLLISSGSCPPCLPDRICPCTDPVYGCAPKSVLDELRAMGPLQPSSGEDFQAAKEKIQAEWTRLDQAKTLLDHLASGCAHPFPGGSIEAVLADFRFHAMASQVMDAKARHAFVENLPRMAPTKACQLSVSALGELRVLRVSPDGRWLAAGGEGGVRLYDRRTQERVATIETLRTTYTRGQPATVVALAFSPDSTRLAVSAYGRPVSVYRIPTGEVLATLPSDDENFVVAFGRTRRGSPVLLVDGLRGAPRAFDPRDGRVISQAQRRLSSQVIAAHPHRPIAYSPGFLWDIGSGRVVRELDTGKTGELAAVFSPNGRWLLVGDGYGKRGGPVAVHLFDALTARARGQVVLGRARGNDAARRAARDPVLRMVFVPGSARVLVLQKGQIHLLDLRRKKVLATRVFEEPIETLDISPDGTTLYLGSRRGIVLTRSLTGLFGSESGPGGDRRDGHR